MVSPSGSRRVPPRSRARPPACARLSPPGARSARTEGVSLRGHVAKTQSAARLARWASLAALIAVGCVRLGPNQEQEAEQTERAEDIATAIRDVCADQCDVHRSCFPSTPKSCEADCRSNIERFGGKCRELMYGEALCTTELSCEQYASLAESRRKHPICGEIAEAFFERCTYGDGTVPRACIDFCARVDECALANAAPRAACEENCTLYLTDLYWGPGKACVRTFEQVYQCYSLASCESLDAAINRSTPPIECDYLQSEANTVCL